MNIPQQCPVCNAVIDQGNVYTSWYYHQGMDPKLILSLATAYTRFCQYAIQRGQQCSNPCRSIVQSETFEARAMGLAKDLERYGLDR